MEKDRLVCQNKRAPTCTELTTEGQLHERAASARVAAGWLDMLALSGGKRHSGRLARCPPARVLVAIASRAQQNLGSLGALDNYDMPELALDIARMVAGLARRPCARCLAASTLSGGKGRLAGLHGGARAGYNMA